MELVTTFESLTKKVYKCQLMNVHFCSYKNVHFLFNHNHHNNP